jgi:hypothetical protein
MIDVYETPIHIGQRFDLILQILGDVVSSPQWHLRRKNNVDLNEVLRT